MKLCLCDLDILQGIVWLVKIIAILLVLQHLVTSVTRQIIPNKLNLWAPKKNTLESISLN